MFSQMDKDGSGGLSREEFAKAELARCFDAFETALQHYSTHLNTFTARPWGVGILMLQCRDFRATRGI